MTFTPIVVSKYGRLTPRFDETIKRWRDHRTGRFSKPGVTLEQVCTSSIIDHLKAVAGVQAQQD